MTDFTIRNATSDDESRIYHLYRSVAATIGGIAREEDEITPDYVASFLATALKTGISMVVEDQNGIVAEIHVSQPEPRVFRHILSGLTIVVSGSHQGKGIGRRLFSEFLDHITKLRPGILRVELVTRESNQKAIHFYQSLGFVSEGTFRDRILSADHSLEADIPMVWFNANFTGSH